MVHVIAHRGASVDLAEHTLAAYERAVEVGADAVECDVRLTADGVLVCVHDRRVDRTSNGRGPVSTLELAELAELDFASWRGGDGSAASVLTLDALLAYVHDCGRTLRVESATQLMRIGPRFHGDRSRVRRAARNGMPSSPEKVVDTAGSEKSGRPMRKAA